MRMADEIEKRGLHFAYTVMRDMTNARRGWGLRSAYLDQPLGKKNTRSAVVRNELHYAAERKKEREGKRQRQRERERSYYLLQKKNEHANEFRSSKIFMTPLRYSVPCTNIGLSLGELYLKKCQKCVFIVCSDSPV